MEKPGIEDVLAELVATCLSLSVRVAALEDCLRQHGGVTAEELEAALVRRRSTLQDDLIADGLAPDGFIASAASDYR